VRLSVSARRAHPCDTHAGAAVTHATRFAAWLADLTARLAQVLDALDSVPGAGAAAGTAGTTRLPLDTAELARVVDATDAVATAAATLARAAGLVEIAALHARHFDTAEARFEASVQTRDVAASFVVTAAHRIGADVFDALGSRRRAGRGAVAARLIRAATSNTRVRLAAERAGVAAAVTTIRTARLIRAAAGNAHLRVVADSAALAIAVTTRLVRSATVRLARTAATERTSADADARGANSAGATGLVFPAAGFALAATAAAATHVAGLAVAVATVLLRGAAVFARAGGARTVAAAAHGAVRDALVSDATATGAAHVTRATGLPVTAARFAHATGTDRAGVAHVAFTAGLVDRATVVGRNGGRATLARPCLARDVPGAALSRRPRVSRATSAGSRVFAGGSGRACAATFACAPRRTTFARAATSGSGRSALARLSRFGRTARRTAGATSASWIVVTSAAIRERETAEGGEQKAEAQWTEGIRATMIVHETLV
jgi:hypothetical protein